MKKLKLIIVAFVLCFGFTMTIQSHNIAAKKADVVLKNTQNKVSSITKYHDNNRVAYVEKNTYYTNGQLNKKTIIKYDNNGKKIYDYTRFGYSNGKAKQTTVYSSFYNGNYRKREINQYRSNGKISYKEIITRNNSYLIIDNSKFYYNSIGQLKSNKYGSASKVVYKYYSNNKVSSKTSYKYNAAGKLYNKVVNTKSYIKNKPLSVGEKIANTGKTFVNQNMVCTEFVSKTLIKAGFKLNNQNWMYAFGKVNGHKYQHVFYEPAINVNSKVFVIKNSVNQKEYQKYINSKNFPMNKNQLTIVNNQTELKKQLRVGDIIEYNNGAHYAIYIGGNKAVQGGLADKNGKYQRVGIASLDLGKAFKITEIVRINKL